MLKVIILSKNYSEYRAGYYHDDIVKSWEAITNAFAYGPGYSNYRQGDKFEDVVAKSPFEFSDIDLVVFSTSWDQDDSKVTVDPAPSIMLPSNAPFKKLYYLNKEYKKFDLRIDYAVKQSVDLVITVNSDFAKWNTEHPDLKFIQVHFGVNLSRFNYCNESKVYDFGFTGSLHASHLDYRKRVKMQLFKPDKMHIKATKEWKAFGISPIQNKFADLNIFWSEFGARGLFYNSLLPVGEQYVKFLCRFKSFLNTPSAAGIFNTRFFELMACKTLVVCPRVDEYDGIMADGENCLMFNADMSDFEKIIRKATEDKIRDPIVDRAHKFVQMHSYDSRVKNILTTIGMGK